MTTKETISWLCLFVIVVVILWKQSQETTPPETPEQTNKPDWIVDYYQNVRERRTSEDATLNYDIVQRQNVVLETCLSQFQEAVDEHRQCSNDVERLQQDFDELGRRMAETNRLFLNILQSLE